MPKFAVKMGVYYEFYGQTAGEVVPEMQERSKVFVTDEADYLKRTAASLCELSGKYFCYSSRECLAESMIRHGLLEVVD